MWVCVQELLEEDSWISGYEAVNPRPKTITDWISTQEAIDVGKGTYIMDY